MEDGPPHLDAVPTYLAPYSSSSQYVHFCVRGCHPVSRTFQTLPLTHTDSGLLSRRLRRWPATGGISRLISFPRVLQCLRSRSPSSPMDSVNDSVVTALGFPIAEIAGYNGSYHLTDAYRRLARPSSPLTAGHPPCTLHRLTSQPEDVLSIHHGVRKI